MLCFRRYVTKGLVAVHKLIALQQSQRREGMILPWRRLINPWPSTAERWLPHECVPANFVRSAFLWEAQSVYREPRFAYHQWRDGRDYAKTLWHWLAPSRAAAQQGKTVTRVAAFADPLTEFQRWQLTVANIHEQAGEHLGGIDAERAIDLGLPGEDFWLLDDTTVVQLIYREQIVRGAVVLTDPADVAPYRHGAALARQYARPPSAFGA